MTVAAGLSYIQRVGAALILLAGLAVTLAAAPADLRHSGQDHFFNLEYDDAIRDFNRLIEQNPDDPLAYSNLAAAQLFQELYRLGKLESSALRGDNQFLQQEKPQPDPAVKTRFYETLERGRRVGETLLARNPRHELAIYALANDYALEANYEFMVDKAWFSALRNGSKARDYCERLRKLNPGFIDAYLVLGVNDYVVGSLPLPVKLLASLGGFRGSKSRGEEYVARVAREGNYARDDARVLLVVLHRREKRPLEAARQLEDLIRDFPRNFAFGLELGSMYMDAGRNDLAVTVFRGLLDKAAQNAPGYQRFPRDAVRRKIEKLEADLRPRAGGLPATVRND